MKKNLFNKFWLRVGMIAAVMTTALAGTVKAEDFTIGWGTATGTEGTYKNFTSTSGTVANILSFTTAKNEGTTNPSYNSNNNDLRLYYNSSGNGGSITLNPATGVTITGFVMTTSTSPSVKYTVDGGTATSVSSTNNGTTYSVTGVLATNSLMIQNVNTTNTQLRIKTIKITYTTSGSSSAVATTTTIDASGITNTDVYAGTAAGSLSATVTANGSAVSGATVTWSSSDEDVATIASSGAVTLVGKGTVTFTATYAGVANTYQASFATYEMTVTDSTPDYVTLPFEWNGGASADLLTLVGVTANGLGSDYAASNAPYRVKFDNDGDYIQVKTDSQPGKVTIGVKMLGGAIASSITVQESADGETFTDVETLNISGDQNTVLSLETSNAFKAASRYVRLYFTKGSNVGVGPITITKFSTDPSISASDVNIAYNATSGSINYAISNPVEGTSLTASTTANWISNFVVGESAVTFTATANEVTESRTATVTLTYGSVTKDVTVTQAAAPLIYTTIPALFAAATSTSTPVTVTFGNWVVTGVNGGQVFVTDGTNGFIIYQSGHGFEVGNTLSGTVSCNLVLFNGSAELTGLTSTTEGLTVGTNGSVTPVATTIGALGAVNTGSVVTLSNLTCSVSTSGEYTNYDLSDGTNTIRAFSSIYDFTANSDLEDGNTYSVTGIFCYNTSIVRIYPRSDADIEEYVAPTHTATFFVNGVEQTDDEVEVSEGATITFPATPADIDGKTFVGWTTTEITGTTDTAPAIVTSATMGTADVTYYAVFATSTSGGASDTYALVSNVSDLSDGDKIILVSTGSYNVSGQTHYFTVANGSVNSSNLMDPVDVTITDNQVTSTEVAPITLKAVTDGWKLQMGTEYINIVPTKNQITLDENGAVNTISITSGDATIGTADGSDTRNIYYNPNSGNGRFAYYKSAQKPVSIYKQEGGVTYSGYCTTVAVPTSQTVTVTNAGYATIVAEADLTIPAGVEVFAVTVNEAATSAHLEPIEGGIPAGEAVLVKASEDTYEFPYAAEEVAALTISNDLVAATAAVTADGSQYCLAQKNDVVGFYKVQAGVVIPAGKAYLVIESSVGQAKAFYGFEEDDPTAIEMVNGQSSMVNEIYNLAGQRLQKMQRGINIVGGRKVLK